MWDVIIIDESGETEKRVQFYWWGVLQILKNLEGRNVDVIVNRRPK